ncbi:MAG: hypothetical protein JWQ33_2539 [Ramlibacter sp.]|nr:hypothetical protein [Ramlibacter sp.]
MRLSGKDRIALSAGGYTAKVAPAAGGRVASLVRRVDGEDHPLLVEWTGAEFDEHAWPKAGAFAMLPFANRLPREGFRFGGRMVRPEPGPAGFALHGIAHRRPWDVVLSTPSRVVMRYAHDGADSGWPWAWSATQEVRLAESGMTVTISVRNESCEPMPLAMGWHPYHAVPADIAPGGLRFDAGARRDIDTNGRAQGPEIEPVFLMRRGETAAFEGWTGGLQLRGPCGGTIAIGSEGAGELVLHRPATGDYLCAEPVGALPGHLAGALPLQPAETRRLSWTCDYQAAAFKE